MTVGKSDQFDELKVFAGAGDSDVSHEDVAQKLGMTAGAVKVSVHRLRRRCREILREEIGQTVVGSEEVDEELRGLFTVPGE